MKEALQQVDRQRQNDTLVNAIGMATKMMSKTIYESIKSLDHSLDTAFRRLSVQLEWQHQRSLEEVSRLESAMGEQNERLQRLNIQMEEAQLTAEAQARVQAANQEMTNVLLRKINVSSTRLASDMDLQMNLVHHIPV